MKKILAAALILSPFVAARAATVKYEDEAAFLSQIAPGYYLEDFSSHTNGSPLAAETAPVAFEGNGFSYAATATPNGLWSGEGALTTTYSTETLVITFTGAPVTAVGGIVAGTDILGDLVADSPIRVRTNDGSTITVLTPAGGGFAGFVSDTPIASITFTSLDPTEGTWAQLDHFYVGVIPEPGIAAILAGATCLLLPRRRARSAAGR